MKSELFKDAVHNTDYDSADIPDSVKKFEPLVYAESANSYCCVYGDDPQVIISGCGPTPIEAMKDWDKHYQEQISNGHIVTQIHDQDIIDEINAEKNKNMD